MQDDSTPPKDVLEEPSAEEYTEVQVPIEGEAAQTVLVPPSVDKGFVEEKAKEVIRQIMRAEAGLVDEKRAEDTQAIDLIADSTSAVVAQELISLYLTTFPDQAAKDCEADDLLARARKRLRGLFLHMIEGDAEKITRRFYRQIAAMTLTKMAELHSVEELQAMSAEDYDDLFYQHYEEELGPATEFLVAYSVQDFSRLMLDGVTEHTHSVDGFRNLLGLTATTDATREFQEFHQILSDKASQTIDRAARGPRGWNFPDDELPVFRDPRNNHSVQYYSESVPVEALRESVERLTERSADVWRLITAEALDRWKEGEVEPPAFWIDVRQLCDAMGYAKHHKGGHKPEHTLIAAQALQDLANFQLIIPKGEAIFEYNPQTGKRQRTKLEAQRRFKVLEVPVTDEVRDMFGNTYPMRWKIRAGEWIRGYPRQFAPLYRKLVELPSRNTTDKWAKSIGTELTWQYKQHGGSKTLKVRTILEQSSLLAPILEEPRNRGRNRKYLEEALDLLQKEGVCEVWQYHPDDLETATNPQPRGWFDAWLDCRIIFTIPKSIQEVMAQLENSRKKKQRKARSSTTRKGTSKAKSESQ